MDVLAEIRAINQQLESPPRRLQILQRRLMQDGVHLQAQFAIELGDHLIDQLLVDGLLALIRLKHFGNERRHAALGDGIAFMGRFNTPLFVMRPAPYRKRNVFDPPSGH
jgi:hypothetical protein